MNHDLYVGSKFYIWPLPFVYIKFDYPKEYLRRIEGVLGTEHGYHFHGNKVTCVTSITFKTNIKTYGPYGNPKPGPEGKTFKSSSGKILGFWGGSVEVLDRLAAFNLGDMT